MPDLVCLAWRTIGRNILLSQGLVRRISHRVGGWSPLLPIGSLKEAQSRGGGGTGAERRESFWGKARTSAEKG